MRGATSRASTFVFVGIPVLYYSAAKFFPKNGVGHMAAKPHDRKRGRFQLNSMLWRPYSDIQQSAQQYRTTGLLKSDRAYLVYCFIVTSVISLTFAIFSDVGPLGGECLIWEECFLIEGVLWEIAIFGFLSIFILMGHLWAMGLAIILYTVDKILLMLLPISAKPVGQIAFALLCWQIGSTSIRVEIAHKRGAKSQTQANRRDPPMINS